ncbi:MucR family transcriptional regulator [Bosea lathyri]|uniref:Transcriptional regulator, MucR family n=1 Tax=Bosea lathyri TaxID=1036778 RepID=A0A1H5XF94_9HYPH|nr:MucR family transcriptional regulator [Bosea lathyri]SEG09876.1 transcriptional regulator, MucR family [Bosea lathyri]
MSDNNIDVVGLSADIVAAYVTNNSVPVSDLPSLIAAIHAALLGLGMETTAPPLEKQVPAVPIRKSITPNLLICLEDGLAFKTLKRHLRNRYGMTPEEYRMKWGLPPDYPMVAPNYAEQRSQMAKAIGFGRKTVKPKNKARSRAA